MDELIGSLKVDEKKSMNEMQIPKGEIIALKAYQKTKTKHQCKALSSIVVFDVENNYDEFSEEDEEELSFLTKRVQRFLRRRKGPRRNFSNRDFQQGESFRDIRCF